MPSGDPTIGERWLWRKLLPARQEHEVMRLGVVAGHHDSIDLVQHVVIKTGRVVFTPLDEFRTDYELDPLSITPVVAPNDQPAPTELPAGDDVVRPPSTEPTTPPVELPHVPGDPDRRLSA